MNYSEAIKEVLERLKDKESTKNMKLSGVKAKEIIDTLFEVIADSLRNGVEVRLLPYVGFSVKTLPPRKIHNPATLKFAEIGERKVIKIKPYVSIKSSVQ